MKCRLACPCARCSTIGPAARSPVRVIQAVTMAGISGGFLSGEDLDSATIDEPSIRSKGSMLGAAGMIVFDDSRDMIQAAHSAMEFFAHESCGKCFPCRIGTQRLDRAAGRRWAERSERYGWKKCTI